MELGDGGERTWLLMLKLLGLEIFFSFKIIAESTILSLIIIVLCGQSLAS